MLVVWNKVYNMHSFSLHDAWNGEPTAQFGYLTAHPLLDHVILGRAQHFTDEAGDQVHLRLAEAAGGDSRGADADTARPGRGLGVVGDRVLVDRHTYFIERALRLLACDAERAYVYQHKVVVCST